VALGVDDTDLGINVIIANNLPYSARKCLVCVNFQPDMQQKIMIALF
jgi:hypothetical protein